MYLPDWAKIFMDALRLQTALSSAAQIRQVTLILLKSRENNKWFQICISVLPVRATACLNKKKNTTNTCIFTSALLVNGFIDNYVPLV